MKIIRQHAADDFVISKFIMRGTHKGDFFGLTPTNFLLLEKKIDKHTNGMLM